MRDQSEPVSIPAPESLTPMMRQYYDLKARAQDAILFFRMGDFYEIFGEDALEVAPKLEIVLTAREKGDAQKIPFCGVPHHAAKGYWLKLLKMGYKVAIADQMENPEDAKGIVRRDIVRIMTPGCIEELEGLEQDSPNYMMVYYEDPARGKTWVAIADVSTGELRVGQAENDGDVRSLLARFSPKEILVRRFAIPSLKEKWSAGQDWLMTAMPEAILRDVDGQRQIIREVLGATSLKGQPAGDLSGAEIIIAALFTHIKQLQGNLTAFAHVRALQDPQSMALCETAIRDLEIFETAHQRRREGSLFHTINATLTPMGARALRHALLAPLVDAPMIEKRHKAVAEIAGRGSAWLGQLRSALQHTPDLERIIARMLAKTIHPHELGLMRGALSRAQGAWALCHPAAEAPAFRGKATLDILTSALLEQPLALGSGEFVFAGGCDGPLDERLHVLKSGQAQIDAYEELLRQETGINSLKIRSHKSFGFLIEVTKTHAQKVPAHFIRRQTMVNGERFVTDQLKQLEATLSSAGALAVEREAALYQELLEKISKETEGLRAVSAWVAALDVAQGFAWLALEHKYVRPQMKKGGELHITAGRHPVVERLVGQHRFTPNDVRLSVNDNRQLLITGPNMAGKSTVMRQTAIIAILAQAGGFVPALAATLPVFDQVFTRVGAHDDLSRGQSTFMVEMAEAARILKAATTQSLVILDEVGRGTSTQDGLAIAAAILEDLALRIKPMALFATHYHELVPMTAAMPSVVLAQTEVTEKDGGIQFTHRLIPGASGSSFGVEVAMLAGLPEKVIARAKALLGASVALEVQSEAAKDEEISTKATVRQGASAGHKSATSALKSLTDQAAQHTHVEIDGKIHQALEKLRALTVNRLTPLQALNILSELQASLDRPAASGPAKGLFLD